MTRAGRVAGHVDLRAHAEPFTGHRCELGMGVRRDLRRIGLASRLLAHATHWAAAQGLQWIDLQVLSANEPAVALYRREGFLMQGGRPDMFVIDGVSLGEIWMARKVTQSVALDPKFDSGWFNLAAMYASAGRFDDALAALDKVLALNPKAEDARAMRQHVERDKAAARH